jgi:hypothetical protein
MGQVYKTGAVYHLAQARAHLRLALGVIVRHGDINTAKRLREAIQVIEKELTHE